MIEVYVESIRVNMTNYKRVVMLKEKNGERYLPIWIGHFEADAIAIPMQKVSVNRPLTHDLLTQTIGQLGGRCTQAAISRLEDNTFFATIVVDQAGRHVELDCRPSDAISVAIRARVPIYIDDAVMEQAAKTLEAPAPPPASMEQLEGGGPSETPADEGADTELGVAAFLPSAEPAGGLPPELFERLGPVTQPVLASLEWTLGDARRAWRTAIGPGDLLLGLLRERRAAANRVLAGLSMDGEELQGAIEQEISRDRPTVRLTEAAEAVVSRATEEMNRLEERAVGSEHLLLALAGETGSSVGVALDRLGVSVESIRRQIAVLLVPPPGDLPSPPE